MPKPAAERTVSVPKFKSPRNLSLIIVAAVLLVIVLVVVLATGNSTTDNKTAQNASNSGCGPYRKDKIVTINGHVFKAETPYNQDAFSKGLGGRVCIPADAAMLFPFKNPGQYAFWMKNMKFPIDIVWIGPDLRVAWADANIQPDSYPSKFANPQDHLAQFILELKANTIKSLDLKIGTPVSF